MWRPHAFFLLITTHIPFPLCTPHSRSSPGSSSRVSSGGSSGPGSSKHAGSVRKNRRTSALFVGNCSFLTLLNVPSIYITLYLARQAASPGSCWVKEAMFFLKKYDHVLSSQTLFFPQGASTFEQLEKAELRSSRLTVDPSLEEKIGKTCNDISRTCQQKNKQNEALFFKKIFRLNLPSSYGLHQGLLLFFKKTVLKWKIK